MDRSFLSDESVIEASRDFVCIRLATYEDAEEAEFLGKIFKQRGYLANTVFAMLAADGKTFLSRPGRGPGFRNADAMAKEMKEIVRERYRNAPSKRWTDKTLPEMKSLDLAINVASCDGLPLIVAVAEKDEQLESMRKQVASLAWSRKFVGQFVCATVLATDDVRAVSGIDREDNAGIYFVKPDMFGVSGMSIAKLDREEGAIDANHLSALLKDFDVPKKNHRQHVQTGYQFGLKWKTAIPVTDKQAVQAAKRLWGE